MEEIILEILQSIRAGKGSSEEVARIVRAHNKGVVDPDKRYAKKYLMPYYLDTKNAHPDLFTSWDISSSEDREMMNLLRIKPRRTSSGVATITVITKPYPCGGNCVYCPNDIRMPKSYMHNEPACQRAERNFFDPYLQVTARLKTLQEMGHATDKIELIVLGGTFCDYPESYQRWFITRLFAACNEAHIAQTNVAHLIEYYQNLGLVNDDVLIGSQTAEAQKRIDAFEITYNQAHQSYYTNKPYWEKLDLHQNTTVDELRMQHRTNVHAQHRVVGLVVETRPETITIHTLRFLRELGCTKIQVGIQSLNNKILSQNTRKTTREDIARACELIRLFGFKSHTHFMVNLLGQTPESDKKDFSDFVSSPDFFPDEIKLYPVALMAGTDLCNAYDSEEWNPYDKETLIDVLVEDLLVTPRHTRISRMIRDFSAPDIQAGNRMTNLRQLVEEACADTAQSRGITIQEIRFREINNEVPTRTNLALKDNVYQTTNTCEHFLEWITDDDKIAGFLRLSLPQPNAFEGMDLPVPLGTHAAMIREVHVYGNAAHIFESAEDAEANGAQHRGLGKELIEKACSLARESGYTSINVISAIGTQGYYEKLGFEIVGLYQSKPL